MTHLDEKALEAAREQPGTNHDGIIRAYLSALPSSPVSELVEREAHLRSRFNNAVAAWPDIAARVAAGQQFNEWEYASNGDDDDPDDLEYFIGIGPVGNLFSFQSVEGQRKADLIASALKLAAFVTSNPLATRNAELEREVKRLREAVGLLETANSLRRNSSSDVVYEDYYDGLKVEDLEDQARALSTSPQGGEHE